ncbi:MAG: endolytic transglycosylase MltG [Bryobacteraceae bacterium]|nr:endolytic transglycosylase MltG [Bryobacterales bacterium]NUN01435.1 endolytic transglycosylase MltG [Bryobacteraceae bacterium]
MRFSKLLLPAFVLLFLAAAVLGAALFVPYSGFGKETFVDIPKGTATRHMATLLRQAGVIRFDWQFLLARAIRKDARLQAGEYRFHTAASVWTVFDRIVRGDIFYHQVRVPEGHNMFDIANTLEKQKLIPAEVFLKVARDPALIRDLDPQAPSLEGFLFPSTYRIARHTTAEQVCRMMTDEFRRVWKELNPAPETDIHTIVTLASLVEKESALPQERPQVASVYANRLRKGMRMDADPTVIYAALLENRYRGAIYRSDLDKNHPYNTYRHAGLPPGPIANPGRAALEAALRPAETKFLFFVAKPDGSGAHEFTTDLTEHNKAVLNYRRGAPQH